MSKVKKKVKGKALGDKKKFVPFKKKGKGEKDEKGGKGEKTKWIPPWIKNKKK